MKIAIDTSSLSDQTKKAHKVRGIGSYTNQLVSSLRRYSTEHEIVEFASEREIPKGIDIIHYPYFDPFFLSLPLIKKAKTIVTVHDFIPFLFPDYFPAGTKGSLRWQFQRFLLGKIDGVISVSESTKKDCMKLTNVAQNRICTIYSAGADIFSTKLSNSDLSVIKTTYGLPDRFILYVGDATRNKNLPRLIKAANLTGIPLVLVGKALVEEFDSSNPWNYDLVEVKNLIKDPSSFQRLGYVPQRDLVGLYNLAMMMVMPSLYEGFGFPILEAMMAKCPVITSKRGAIPEIAGEAALFVDPESIESIADGISVLAGSESQRKIFIEKGLKQAETFSWKKTAEQTTRFYQETYDR